MANIELKLSSAGIDAGPFTITNNLGDVLATDVTKEELIAGYNIEGVSDDSTSITITSSGLCTNSKTLVVDFSNGNGNGGGGDECANIRFSYDEEATSCRNYTFSINGGIGQAIFTYTPCSSTESTNITLTDNQVDFVCVELSGVDAPTFSGNGFMTEGGSCFEYVEAVITFINCDGTEGSFTMNEYNPEFTRCIKLSSLNVPDFIKTENFGTC